MADIERVWGEEEQAKRNRTLTNPVRLAQDTDACKAARLRIIELLSVVQRLEAENARLQQK